ncbi:MAG: hypothetical protein F6J98_30480 [Moorea sp. SIO4G2]|nr:hypothetical protein [Moorena sp. SIO4G2]
MFGGGPTKIVIEAAKEGLDNFNKFQDFPPKKQKKVRDKFRKDINECIKWLIISLQVGIDQDTDRLKKSFTIKRSSFYPYVVALQYIRDRKLSEYFKNDWEREEVKIFINLLSQKL